MNGRELEARIRGVATEDTEVLVSSMDGGEWPVTGLSLEWRGDHYAAVMKPGARWTSPVIESKLPVIRGRVISSGGGEVRLVVDRRTTDYPAVNERVVVVEQSAPEPQEQIDGEELDRLRLADSALRSVIPSVGQIWHWEPMKSHASERLQVTDVKVNSDGEVWIESGRPYRLVEVRGEKSWNRLSRWMEAAILVEPAEGDE
jgi:hypothetical protein